jgi:glycerate-2-kinase
LSPSTFLDDNDAVNFFNPLGDLIRLGPTDTNVGDLQLYLSAGTPGTHT